MIFFDLDGTLLDHSAAEDAAARAFCRAHAAELGGPDAAFVARWRALTAKHYPRWLSGEIGYLEQRRERMRELFGAAAARLPETELDARFAHYLDAYRASWRAHEDVAVTLAALGDRPLGVITNGETAQQSDKLRRLGILDRFTVVVTPDACGAAKPSAEIFHHAARRAARRVEECVYVGDDLDLDARAATAAGMRGIWLARASSAVAADVEVITTLTDLPRLLR